MVQSSTGKGGSHPNPPPQNEYAKRLEHIRHLRSVPDVKAFWARLVDKYGEDQTRSYASARYYHYDRDPPVDYLGQVSVVYGVPLEYLVFGEGPKSHMDQVRRPSLEERFENPEIVGLTHIHPDFPDEMKGTLRVAGAISQATSAMDLPRGCQSVIADYLIDLVQREGLAQLGWTGGIPQREDIDELKRLASDTIDRCFGVAVRHRTSLRPAEVVASVMATAIPLYLRPASTFVCPGCGKERPDAVHACPHCGEFYPDDRMLRNSHSED